jgi:hypothetical protein
VAISIYSAHGLAAFFVTWPVPVYLSVQIEIDKVPFFVMFELVTW